MKSCTDCGGGVPAPFWARCVECAFQRLRALMSPVALPPSPLRRRWARGDRVLFARGEGEPRAGKITRRRPDGDYILDLDDGRRYYAKAGELREIP